MTISSLALYAGFLLIILVLVKPIGGYLTRVFAGGRTLFDPVLRPVERGIYTLCGIDAQQEMNGKQYALAFVLFSLAGTLLLYAILRLQAFLPFYDPVHLVTPLTPDLAMNTAVSFSTTTTWQAYAGETTMSHHTSEALVQVQHLPASQDGHRRRSAGERHGSLCEKKNGSCTRPRRRERASTGKQHNTRDNEVTPMDQTSFHRIRLLLLILNSSIGLSAVVGGILLLTGIVQFPVTWLSGSSFDSYRPPAVILLAGVGGSTLLAAALLLMDSKGQALAALASGAVLIGWMATEIGIIGWRFWWQPCFLGLGLLTFILAAVLQTSKQE